MAVSFLEHGYFAGIKLKFWFGIVEVLIVVILQNDIFVFILLLFFYVEINTTVNKNVDYVFRKLKSHF